MNSSIDRFRNGSPPHVLIFTSPKAGSGKSRDEIPRLVSLLEEQSIEVRITHEVGDLRALAAADDAERSVVVAAGGDGTLSLAASAVSSAPDANTPALVPLPLGTENLLARHFGYQASADLVLRTIRYGPPYRLDAGTANKAPFLIMATCGFDAEVVRGMHLTRRGHISRMSYFQPIMRALRKYRFPILQLRVDQEEPLECCWAMVFNLPSYGGGLRIEPDAIGDDGLLDIIAFKRGSIPSGLKYVTEIWTGRHLRDRDVVRCRGKKIEITSPEKVPYQLDGDYAGRLPLKIEVRPHCVTLLLPPAG